MDGEIAQIVITYVNSNFMAKHMRAMMVPTALLIRFFSEQKPKALPYSILA